MLAKALYNLNASYVTSHFSKVISKHIPIHHICEEIRCGRYKEQILRARAYKDLQDDENYKSVKKELPAVVFAGEYGLNGARLISNLSHYNSVMVLDIDGVPSEKMRAVGEKLNCCEYIASFWRSPSNLGYKGLVWIKYEGKDINRSLESYHDYAFTCFKRYMDTVYKIKLDHSGSDVSRLCYYSYDPDLVMKEKFYKYGVNIENHEEYLSQVSRTFYRGTIATENIGSKFGNTYKRNKKNHRECIHKIIKYLNNRNLSITYTYYEWRKVALAISDSFTYDIGVKYFMKLSSLDTSKYSEQESIQFLKNCYAQNNGSISFGTIRYLANLKGFREQ